MTCVALWSLFGDDTRLSVFTQAADSTFVAITYVCLALFTVEMAALCVAKPGYVFGFYFWLDFVATASLLLDLPEFMYVTGLQNKDLCLFVLRAASGLDILAAPDLVRVSTTSPIPWTARFCEPRVRQGRGHEREESYAS